MQLAKHLGLTWSEFGELYWSDAAMLARFVKTNANDLEDL